MGFTKLLRELCFDEPPLIDRDVFGLSDAEKWWRDRYSFLEARGYRLRERLKPGWIPSWKSDLSLLPEGCEDGLRSIHPFITYATQIADNSQVIIKKLEKGNEERSIACFLSSQKDERNHCVPIIDTFEDDRDAGTEFIVMPLLRDFNSPPFFTVDEVVDFLRQTLVGISFIHGMNVAHRDCSDLNIMLDGTTLFPDGFHPIHQDADRSWKRPAKFRRRANTPRVKYYFTDFGLSSRFDNPDKDRLVTGRRCQVHVPEFSDSVPYDPFAVDVYLLGDVYKRHFIEKYSNVQFPKPLVEQMVQRDPAQRPSAGDSLKLLDRLISEIPSYHLRWRLIDFKLGPVSRTVINVKCFGREGAYKTGQLIGTRINFSGLRRQ